MSGSFVHLRLHSEYALVDGLVRIKPLMKMLPERGMNAVAVSDPMNLFATVKVFNAALDAGIKPIVAAELWVKDPGIQGDIFLLPLLCQNEIGYKNLTRLISRAYTQGQQFGRPFVDFSWVEEASQGLIALSGAEQGMIAKALLQEDTMMAKQAFERLANCFPGRFYLEVQRTGKAFDALLNEGALMLSKHYRCPIVATNDVRFINASDYDAHEARVCIHEGYVLADPKRNKTVSQEQYLKSADEMCALFHDMPDAIQNSVEIAKRCNVLLRLGENFLPDFPVPEGMTVDSFLQKVSQEGLQARLTKILPKIPKQNQQETKATYQERLLLEVDVINRMGFAGYFLIVADFIRWARENGVPVGPGRGSGAGSLVAYALGITDIDPIPYDLLFERFLNPERVSMPDFDIDFCMEGRDRVIEYVAQKYGRDSVSQIITFGTMAAKAVVRDVGRVLGHPYGFVDKIAKLIPFELGITLAKALEDEPELQQRYNNDEEVKELLKLAMKLEGLTRNAGKHAGGVVIAPKPLSEFTAVYCEQDSTQIVSQFDKDDVEAVGLVKFDFLGLRTLTIIDWALNIIHVEEAKAGLPKLDISDIPLDCPATFSMLKKCQTTAVFQLESRGMKELIGRLQPDCFEDIVALVALFRPGPLQSGMVDDFIDRKHGRAAVIYPHPDLEPVLKPTYGVILYQEQVMQIAQVLANYTLGAADLLRRAMGKKKPEEMAKQREIFTKGALERGVTEEVATQIFDLMEKFAGYGFNKSHSAAYALVSYQTAWLKTHYPTAFMASVLSSDMDNTDKVFVFLEETKQMGIGILPPCVNDSDFRFAVRENAVRFGLGAIKGVGAAAISNILQVREESGPFTSLFDFCKRLDLRRVNRRVMEALIKSGAMDVLGDGRSRLFASLDYALSLAESSQSQSLSGQGSLFDVLESSDEDQGGGFQLVNAKPWSLMEKLSAEKETLGCFMSGHPTEQFHREFKKRVLPIALLQAAQKRKQYILVMIQSVRTVLTKRGKKLYILSVEDYTGKMDCVLFSETWDSLAQPPKSADMVLLEGEVSLDNFSGGLRMGVSQCSLLQEARAKLASKLIVSLSDTDSDKLAFLAELFEVYPGGCPVEIRYQNAQHHGVLALGKQYRLSIDEKLLNEVSQTFGEEAYQLEYGSESIGVV